MNLLRNLILVVFGACQSGQEIEDGKFMQGVLAPIVRGQTKMMTNNEVFMKIKAYYKGNTLWPVLYCPQEMKKMYFLS
jgi:hypothetical protein